MSEAADPAAVGQTPLLELDLGIAPTVYAKPEWFNQPTLPHGGGSIKTRIGKSMLDAARASSASLDGRTLLEASSGNTGAAVARFGARYGLDVEIVMPDDAGAGKIAAIEAAGAETTFVDAARGYDAYVEECREKARDEPDAYHYLNQYENTANPAVHAGTTGPEIWEQTDGAVTHFVAGAGTGGTLVGVSHALQERGVDIYGFEPPKESHDIAGLKHMHSQGVYVPGTYEPGAVETMSFVPTSLAYRYVRWLHRRYESRTLEVADVGQWSEAFVRDHIRVDGDFLVGPSSGACLALVDRLTATGALEDEDVVVIPFPDRGDRYPERQLSGGAGDETAEKPSPLAASRASRRS